MTCTTSYLKIFGLRSCSNNCHSNCSQRCSTGLWVMQPSTSQWAVRLWRAGEAKAGHCQHFRDSQTHTSIIYKEPQGHSLPGNSQ